MKAMKAKNGKWWGVGQVAGTFALGATVGSLLAILFAPASGQATRRRIGTRVRVLQHSAVRGLRQARRLLVRKVGDWREVLPEKLDQTREWLTEHVMNGSGKHTRVSHRSAD